MERPIQENTVIDDKPVEEIKELTGKDPIRDEDVYEFYKDLVEANPQDYRDIIDSIIID